MRNEITDAGKMQPAELAAWLERLPLEEAQSVFRDLSPTQSAAVLGEMEAKDAAHLLESLNDDEIAQRLALLPTNLIADLIAILPDVRQHRLLARLLPEKSAGVSALLRYPPESAGGIMDNRFIAVRADETADECLARLRTSSPEKMHGVLYIYVTDAGQKLVGVVSLRDLVFASAHRKVREIMNRDVRFLRVTDDQEEIARQIQRLHYIGLPVVDQQQRLVGVVKMSDALRIAQTEATEDMQLMVGLSGEERIWTPWHQSIAKRMPWLGVNVGTALLASLVVSLFEDTIARWTALVIFLPLISAVGGNAGIQALTVIIRGFALGEVSPGDALRALRKEFAIGAVNGFALGLVIGLVSIGWKGSVLLGMVSGAAMLLNQVIGALSGVAIPFGLRSLKIDPALASSIFVTTLTDVIGFLVFLGLAALAMRLYPL